MGCGASKNGGAGGETAAGGKPGDPGREAAANRARKQSVIAAEIPDIKVVTGEAVKLTAFPRVIFIFGMQLLARHQL